MSSLAVVICRKALSNPQEHPTTVFFVLLSASGETDKASVARIVSLVSVCVCKIQPLFYWIDDHGLWPFRRLCTEGIRLCVCMCACVDG